MEATSRRWRGIYAPSSRRSHSRVDGVGRPKFDFHTGHDSVDSSTTAKVDDPRAKPIQYPKPDGKLSFPLLENVARAVVDHADTQPSHLVVKDEFRDSMVGKTARSLREFGAPEANFCPAGVYEYPDDELVINAQNCVHCKCCSIKMPLEYIKWTVPEGGGGPNYQLT